MIIVKIWGGLGNQMFQYAAAKSLSLQYNVSLKLDISHYAKQGVNETAREFRLNVFPAIKEEIASINEINEYITTFEKPLFNSIYKILNKKNLLLNRKYLIEKSKSYQPIIVNRDKKLYLEGYWQSEEYFKPFTSQISNQFNLDHLQSISDLDSKVKEISKTNAISIHVRRGDYITNLQASSYHGVCSLNYYEKAIQTVINKTEAPVKFYIFSDDISWCKANLKISGDYEYVSTTEDYYDLYLMSKCKHNIIANSSFSWWATWLNKNKDKTVIAPKDWFVCNSLNNIVPSTWLKI